MREPFVLFSAAHGAGLLAAALAVAAIVGFRAALRRPTANRIARYGLAGLLAASEAALYSWYTITDAWGLYALPFQLCTMTLWFSVFALLTRKRTLVEISFFLGILGALQALATPYLTVGFPDFRYFHFFLAHIGIVSAGVFLTAVDGIRPTWHSALRSLLWLNALAVPAGIANAITGENFMFLARKPSTGSLLDALAPWPWYILELEAVALLMIFALLGIVKAADAIASRRGKRNQPDLS
ncbi:TIGR02206 family membrane protein [Paenibacillus antri]|uniref:TIGR02206 family membrane protein n=1 Tax=Paenibacillus antri TaxID=2582848 RepID=A0A5R9GA80_9BACL|nr:TIGR02206 family membrane protein [Paenibacillus antri]TLS50278.1 TIGR02206 family membrane protein [Paenibacillus antri]